MMMMMMFGVHTMADNILGFKFPRNRQKWPSIYKHVLASANGLKHRYLIL